MRTPAVILIALATCNSVADDYPQRAQDETIVETVLRLENFDLSSSAKGKAAVLRYLEHNLGDEKFFQLLEKYEIPEARSLLVHLTAERSTDTAGVVAARILIERGEMQRLEQAIDNNDEDAAAIITALGLCGGKEVAAVVEPVMLDAKRPLAVRSAAATALGRQPGGHALLLSRAVKGQLAKDLHFTVGNILRASGDPAIREAAAKHLPSPAAADAQPLPPLTELVQRGGDAKRGHNVFATKGTCAKCHKVRGEGKEIGPDLSEIGSKLSREAMFVAILDPSAGISHNYESFQVILVNGTIFSGLKISETDDALTLRSAEGIERTIPRDDIDEVHKQKTSLMPADLQQLMTAEELVNVVAYLSTLKTQAE